MFMAFICSIVIANYIIKKIIKQWKEDDKITLNIQFVNIKIEIDDVLAAKTSFVLRTE